MTRRWRRRQPPPDPALEARVRDELAAAAQAEPAPGGLDRIRERTAATPRRRRWRRFRAHRWRHRA